MRLTSRYSFILYFIYSFLYAGNIQAQISNTGYLQFGPNQGLPSAEVYDICQASDGLLWIATDRGVCSFDGYQFKNYGVEEGLTDPTIWNIIPDDRGRLWFLGLTGKLFYLENKAIHEHHDNYQLMEAGITTLPGARYLITSDFLYVLYSSESKLLKLNLETNKARIISMAALPGKYTVRSIVDLFRLCITQKKLRTFPEDAYFELSNIRAILPRDSILSSSFVTFLENQFVIKYGYTGVYFYKSPSGELSTALNGAYYNALEQGIGKRRYICQNNVLGELKHNSFDTLEIFDAQLSGVCFDNEGGLWVSTLSNGIYYKPNLYIKCAVKKGLRGEITFLNKSQNDGVWIINKGGDIWKVELDHRETGHRLKPKVKVTGVLMEDEKLKLVFNTEHQVIGMPQEMEVVKMRWPTAHFLGGERSITSLGTPIRDSALGNVTSALAKPYKNGHLMATDKGLVFRTNDSIKFYGDEFEELGTRISYFTKHGDSLLLASIGRGLMIYDIKTSTLRVLNQNNSDLPSLFCHHITPLINGAYWISTNEGLVKLERKDLDLEYVPMTTFTTSDGLTSNEILKSVAFDSTLFVAGRRSVDRIDLRGRFERRNHDYQLRFSSVEADGKPIDIAEKIEVPPDTRSLKIRFRSLCYRCNQNMSYYYKLDEMDDKWTATSERFMDLGQLISGTHNLRLMAKGPKMNTSKMITLQLNVPTPFYKRWWVLLLGVVFVCSIVSLFIFQHLARINLRNQLVQYQYSAFSSQLKPHFVFNILSSIQNSFLKQRPEEGISQIGSLAKLLRITLSSSDALFISLQKDLDNLESYMSLESIRYQIPFEYDIVLNLKSDSNNLLVPPLILQPLVENAIYHGLKSVEYPGEIKIEVVETNNLLAISVTDNGIGINAARRKGLQKTSRKSFGLALIQKRVHMVQKMNKMRSDFDVIDLEEHDLKGTRISFNLPIKHHV